MHSSRAQDSGGGVNELTKNFALMKTLREDKIQPKERAVDVIALLKALHPATTPPTTPLPKNSTHMKTLREDKIQPKERAIDVIALLKAVHPATTPPTTPRHDAWRTKRQINF